jgi:hypothetical protein
MLHFCYVVIFLALALYLSHDPKAVFESEKFQKLYRFKVNRNHFAARNDLAFKVSDVQYGNPDVNVFVES